MALKENIDKDDRKNLRHRETDRQTDRQTDRPDQTRQTETERDRWTQTEKIDRDSDRHRQTDQETKTKKLKFNRYWQRKFVMTVVGTIRNVLNVKLTSARVHTEAEPEGEFISHDGEP
jgi:hypothetical protein